MVFEIPCAFAIIFAMLEDEHTCEVYQAAFFKLHREIETRFPQLQPSSEENDIGGPV